MISAVSSRDRHLAFWEGPWDKLLTGQAENSKKGRPVVIKD